MNKTAFWTGIVLFVIGVLGFFLFASDANSQIYWIVLAFIGLITAGVGLISTRKKKR